MPAPAPAPNGTSGAWQATNVPFVAQAVPPHAAQQGPEARVTVGVRRHHLRMSASVSELFDAFLAHRWRAVGPRTYARDREVLEAFRACLDADGPVVLDEATGRPLGRHEGGIGLCDLAEVDAVVDGAAGFLEDRLPLERRRAAAHVLRLFVLWLLDRRVIGPCEALQLQVLTARYAPTPRRTGRPGSGSTRRRRRSP